MSTDTFVWKYFFEKLITAEHPAVYQYIKGGERSKESAVMRVTEEVYDYCNPYWMGDATFDITFIRGITRIYMKYMETEWKSGRLSLKEIYQRPLNNQP